METETVLLDEHGTPGQDELFLVGGLSFRVDAAVLEGAWRKKRDDLRLKNRKGRDLTDNELVGIADFVRAHGALPCVFFSRLSESEREWAGRVFENASEARALTIGQTGFGPFLWALHVTTAASSIATLACLLRGRTEALSIHVDRMKMKAPHSAMVDELIPAWLTREYLFDNEAEERITDPAQRAVHERLRATFAVTRVTIHLDRNLRGPLKELADCMCTLAARAAASPGDSYRAFQRFKSDLAKRGVRDTFPMDLTPAIRRYLQDLEHHTREVEQGRRPRDARPLSPLWRKDPSEKRFKDAKGRLLPEYRSSRS
jgi:hypothetical protein